MFRWLTRTVAIPVVGCIAIGCASAQPGDPAGAELYARHCGSCHGVFGEGDGPVAQVMEVSVPNLRTLSDRAGGEFPRDAVMAYIDGRDLPAAHGARLMPVWGDTFAGDGEAAAADRIAAITDFVERLQN